MKTYEGTSAGKPTRFSIELGGLDGVVLWMILGASLGNAVGLYIIAHAVKACIP